MQTNQNLIIGVIGLVLVCVGLVGWHTTRDALFSTPPVPTTPSKSPLTVESKGDVGLDSDAVVDAEDELYEKTYKVVGDIVYFAPVSHRYSYQPDCVEVQGVDADTFEVVRGIGNPTWGLARDAYRVYLDGVPVPLNLASLRFLPSKYFADEQAVYEVEQGTRYVLRMLPYSTTTFRVIIPTAYTDYVADHEGVYYAGAHIKGLDPDTFRPLSQKVQQRLDDGEYDLDNYYMRDAHHIVHQGAVLRDVDVETFRPIDTGPFADEYGTDGVSVWYGAERIVGADPTTFKPLSRQRYEGCRAALYSIDVTRVYFHESLVEGADPTTFEALMGAYTDIDGVKHYELGRDRHGIYVRDRLEPGIDPKTFEPLCDFG